MLTNIVCMLAGILVGIAIGVHESERIALRELDILETALKVEFAKKENRK